MKDKSDAYNDSDYSRNARPGASIDVQRAFVLTSETSVVEFEIAEIFNLSGDTVAMNFNPAELGG